MSCAEVLIALLLVILVCGAIFIVMLVAVIKAGVVGKIFLLLFKLYGKRQLLYFAVRNAPQIYRLLLTARCRVSADVRRVYHWIRVRLNS